MTWRGASSCMLWFGLLMRWPATRSQNMPSIEASQTGNITFRLQAGGAVGIAAGPDATFTRFTTETELSTYVAQLRAVQSSLMAATSTLAAQSSQITQLRATQAPATPAPSYFPTAPPSIEPRATLPPSPVPWAQCPNGPNGGLTGCAVWRSITTYDIKDIAVYNVQVNVTSQGSGVFQGPGAGDGNEVAIIGQPTARGCGSATNIFSSMGVYIAGAWTKIRYRMRAFGRASCSSAFGSTQYNAHEHTDVDDLTPGEESISGVRLYRLGQEMGGLFPYNASIDSMTGSWVDRCNRVGRDGGCINVCDSRPSPWTMNTAASPYAEASVELRRYFQKFYNGVRQYAVNAGPSAGVSCVAIGTSHWVFDQIQILE